MKAEVYVIVEKCRKHFVIGRTELYTQFVTSMDYFFNATGNKLFL